MIQNDLNKIQILLVPLIKKLDNCFIKSDTTGAQKNHNACYSKIYCEKGLIQFYNKYEYKELGIPAGIQCRCIYVKQSNPVAEAARYSRMQACTTWCNSWPKSNRVVVFDFTSLPSETAWPMQATAVHKNGHKTKTKHLLSAICVI